ncbi:MAG: hypothetical protein ABR551_06680 [Gemmatimonadales bacterium]
MVWVADPDTTVTLYRDLALVGDQVWVLSQTSPFLHRYANDGFGLGATLRVGDGPTELRLPNWIVPSSGSGEGGVAAFVVHRMRELVPLDSVGGPRDPRIPFTTGGGVSMQFLSALSYGEAQLVRRGPAGRLVVQRQEAEVVQQPRDIGNALVLLLDTTGVVLDTIADLAAMMADLSDEQVKTFVPLPLWAMCGEETVVTYSPREDALAWRTLRGDVTSTVEVRSAPRAITQADRRRFARAVILRETRGQGSQARQLLASLGSLVTQMGPSFAKTAPPAVRVLCDWDGTAWLQLFDTEVDPRGYGREWWSFTPTGSQARLLMPGDFHPQTVAGGQFTGWLTDEDGVQRVARVVAPGRR